MITGKRRRCKMQWGSRYFSVLVLGMLLGSGPSTQAQTHQPNSEMDRPRGEADPHRSMRDLATLLLLQAQQDALRSEQEKKEFEGQRDLERLRVPSHNYLLASAVAEFQRHISDLHHRHTSCKLCRDHVKKIKTFAKKIDSAMK